MHLDVVAVLVVFCIAFTVSSRSDQSNNEFLPQPTRHTKRHHRQEEKHVARPRERNRNSNLNNHRHPNNFNNNSNKNGNRKRGKKSHEGRSGNPHHSNNGRNEGWGPGSGPSSLPLLLPNNNIQGGAGDQVFECCPSETRMVEMVYGVSRNNTLLEIFNNASKPQRFYEIVCKPSVINRTCSFVDAAYQPNSRCVERFTYTYAIVRDYPFTNNVPYYVHRADNSEWRLDYIRIRSGCFCEIIKSTNR